MKHLVFVYGTLKKGMKNQCYLSYQRYIGVGITEPVYKLYKLDHFPILIRDLEFPIQPIYGEVYEVDEYCLANLDELEGFYNSDSDLYKRVKISLLEINAINLPTTQQTFEDFQSRLVWCYVFDQTLPENAVNCGSFWSQDDLQS